MFVGLSSYFADTLANSEASKHTTAQPTPHTTTRDRIITISSVSGDPNGFARATKAGPPSSTNSAPITYQTGTLP